MFRLYIQNVFENFLMIVKLKGKRPSSAPQAILEALLFTSSMVYKIEGVPSRFVSRPRS